MKTVIPIVLILILFASGCSAEKYGAGVSMEFNPVKVKDVMLNPSLQGRVVNLEGIIISQCAANGCWLFLKDDTGQIFIDLAPKGFAIPPRTGKKAKVTGMVSQGQAGIQIIAYGVEVS